MKRYLLTGLLAAALPPLGMAASPEGVWLTEGGSAQIEISRCGDAYCGHTVWLENPYDDEGELARDSNNPDSDLRDRELIGLKILWDMEPAPRRDNRWEGGRVYDPENGNTYRARMDLEDEDTLSLRGYVGAPMFGRTSTWTREEEIRELSD
ncbi:MAG: DUF2147 domain-containing protein [Ectothiorhodospiraceae bacterium]|nr:DUF2147 domain-containing protein [Ectothiorhodospiraceae bacterium]MCH8504932.1 DUF2147 domain-containing protein [Ectothiorhodospiraceae bacterium]